MGYIILYNAGLWFNLMIPFGVGIFLYFTNKDYIFKEFAIQIGVSITVLLLFYFALFRFTTDLVDFEFINTKVAKWEYFEKWTEEVTYYEEICTGSGDSRSCVSVPMTRDEYHPPYWQIVTANGNILSISEKQFRQASNNFGSHEEDVYRSNQVSWGDGNKYVSYPSRVIPIAVKETYTNYVIAAKHNVVNEKVSESELNEYIKNKSLQDYPKQYRSEFGSLKLNRLIDTTNRTSFSNMRNGLDLIATKLGNEKQANPIIYVTDEGRDFFRILKNHWNGGKKNDVTLILGIDKNTNKITWSNVITYTNETDFIVDCQKKFNDFSINETEKILQTFENLISKGYVRKPMEEFSYLRENITLEWYWQLLVFLTNLLLSGFIFYEFLNNWHSKREN